jgi:hypothetical protein
MLSGTAGCLVGYDAGGSDGELDIGCHGIRCSFGIGWLFKHGLRTSDPEEEYEGRRDTRRLGRWGKTKRKQRLTPRNIVATVNLECRLDLKTIALHARNAEYNPKVSFTFPLYMDLSLAMDRCVNGGLDT